MCLKIMPRAHTSKIVIFTVLIFTSCAFSSVVLPRLALTNATLPTLGVSYASPTNATVKAITDQKNGELFQAGTNGIFFSVGRYNISIYSITMLLILRADWKNLETSPGVFDLSPMTSVLSLVTQINAVKPQVWV